MVANAFLRSECAAEGSLTPQKGDHTLLLGAACPDVGPLETLGDEEAAVTRLWIEGKTHREIAELRRRSPHTVANQLAATYEKLGVSGRFELVARLMANDRPSAERRA
jgi:DNA-binding CsgD family transcriptional regulator